MDSGAPRESADQAKFKHGEADCPGTPPQIIISGRVTEGRRRKAQKREEKEEEEEADASTINQDSRLKKILPEGGARPILPQSIKTHA